MLRHLRLVFVLAALAACGSPAAPAPSSPRITSPARKPRAVVTGIVRGTPYEHMPSPIPEDNQPRAEIGPPLAGHTIVLRELTGDDAPAGHVVGSATTDAEGRFRIEAAPGRYFLCVTGSDARWAVETTGKQGKNFASEDHVNDFAIVTLEAGKPLDSALTVHQAWPV